jgi:hypothetical protein
MQWYGQKGNKSDRIAILISIGSLLISGLSLYWAYVIENRYEVRNYKLSAMLNRPQIELVNSFGNLDWEVKPLIDSGIVLNHPLKETDTLQFKMNLVGSLIFKNQGKSKAQLKAIIFSDKFTQDPIIRESLISDRDRQFIRVHLWDDGSFFSFKSISPGDSIFQKVFMPLRHYYQDTLALIHIFVLYEDEAGTLYDTYNLYKLHRKSSRLSAYAQYSLPDSSAILFTIDKRSFPIESEKAEDSYIYTYNESQKIKEWMKNESISK